MPIILWSINIKILWRKKRFNIIYCTVDLCVEIQQGPIYQSLFYSYAIWATDMLRFRNFYTSIFLIIELASKVHWMSMKIYFDIPALHFSPINQTLKRSINQTSIGLAIRQVPERHDVQGGHEDEHVKVCDGVKELGRPELGDVAGKRVEVLHNIDRKS